MRPYSRNVARIILYFSAGFYFFLLFLFLLHQIAVHAFTWTNTALETEGIDYITGESMTVVVESDTKTHLAYCNENNDLVHYTTITSGVTSTPELVQDNNTSCNSRRISMNLVGTTPHIMFAGALNTTELYLAVRDGGGSGTCDDANWNCYDIVTTTYAPNHIAFVIDGSTYGVAFQEDLDDNLMYGFCTSSCTDDSNWTFETVDSSAAIMARGVDLVFTAGGVPVIAYDDLDNAAIKYAIRDGGGSGNCTDSDWNCYKVDEASTPFFDSVAIDIDSSGQIGIAYKELTTEDLWFAFKDGGNTGCTGDATNSFTCEEITGDDGTGIQMQYPSLAFYESVPMVAWYNKTPAARDLQFSYKSGGSWTTEDVVTSGQVGAYASLDVFGDEVSIGYHEVDNGGEAWVAETTVSFNAAPTLTALSPAQNIGSNTIVTVTTTIADGDSDVTNLVLEYSTDNATWTSSTLFGVTQAGGEGDGVVTSTGSITDIDTDNDGSVDLTIEWDINTDLPDTDDSSVYFRLVPNDGTENGATATSGAFVVDTTAPTAPGALGVHSTSTQAAILNFGATSTESNFLEYIIYYKEGEAGVTTSDMALSSTTDENLASVTINDAATTTLSGLSTSTQYVLNIWSFDIYGNSASSSKELAFFTLADTPGTPIASSSSTAALTVTINTSTNPNSTEYSVCTTSDESTCDADGYVGTDGTLGADPTWATSSYWGGIDGIDVSGLSVNTAYQFLVNARNGDNVETDFSSTSTARYTLATPPSSVSATVGGPDEITVNWTSTNSAGTAFQATIDPSATDCDWTANLTSCQFSGLQPGTQYTITVAARNGDDVVTESVSVSATTNPAPIGSGSAAPARPPPVEWDFPCEALDCDTIKRENPSGLLLINSGAPYTNSPNVQLLLNHHFATEYAISGSRDFGQKSFAPIVPSVDYIFDARDGEKVVYATFRNQEGATYVVHDTIILDTVPPRPPIIRSLTSGLNGASVEAKPMITGIAEAHATVRINVTKRGSPVSFFGVSRVRAIAGLRSEVFTVTADADGHWDFTFPDYLEFGDYIFTVTAEDSAGNVSDPSEEYLSVAVNPIFDLLDLEEHGEDIPPADTDIEEPPDTETPSSEPPASSESPDVSPIAFLESDDTSVPETTGGVSIGGGSGVQSGNQEVVVNGIVPAFDEKGDSRAILPQEGEVFRTVQTRISSALTRAAYQTVTAIDAVIDNPEVERANETIVAPTVLAAGAANVATGFQLPDILVFLKYLFGQPVLLLGLRRRKGWGVVYNAFTKAPIDLAVIRVINAKSGAIAHSYVTDTQGRYFFTLKPGTYLLEVDKRTFTKQSAILAGQRSDGIFENLYHPGETFDVTEDKSQINYNIPLDPVGKDEPTGDILKTYSKKIFQRGLSISGFAISGASFVISPTPFTGGLVLLHAIFYGVFRVFAKKKKTIRIGTVSSSVTKRPLPKTVVRVFNSTYSKLVNTAVTDRKGHYGLLVGPSTYTVTYDKPAFVIKESPPLDFSSNKGAGGIIARDEQLVPTSLDMSEIKEEGISFV